MNKEEFIKKFTKCKGVWNVPKIDWNYVKQDDELYNFAVNYFEDYKIEDETFLSLLYRIVYDIKERPICKGCGKEYAKISNMRKGFLDYCSENCRCKLRMRKHIDEFSGEFTIENIKKYFIKDDGKLNSKRMAWESIKLQPKLYNFIINYFSVPVDSTTETFTEVLYRMEHNIERADIPYCKQCGEHRVLFNNYYKGYSEYCSVDCARIYNNNKSHEAKLLREEKHNTYTKENIFSFFYLDDGKTLSAAKLIWDRIKNYDIKLYDFLINCFDTPVDPEIETPTEVLYRIKNNIPEVPMCHVCKTHKLPFVSYSLGYKLYCSEECRIKERDERRAWRKEHPLEKKGNYVHIPKPQDTETYREYTIDELKEMFINDKGGSISVRFKWSYVKTIPGLYKFLTTYFDDINVDTDTPGEILYRIFNNITEKPKCIICGNPLPFYNMSCGYRKYCTVECRNSDKAQELIDKVRVETNKKIWGVAYTSMNDEVRDKQKETASKNRAEKLKNMPPKIKPPKKERVYIPYVEQKNRTEEEFYDEYNRITTEKSDKTWMKYFKMLCGKQTLWNIDMIKLVAIRRDGYINACILNWNYMKRFLPTMYDYMINYFEGEIVDTSTEDASETLYRMEHNIRLSDIPMCKNCGKSKVRFLGYCEGYSDFCCHKCGGIYAGLKRRKYEDSEVKYKALYKDKEVKDGIYTLENIQKFFTNSDGRLIQSYFNWKWIKNYDMKLYNFMIGLLSDEIDESVVTPSEVYYRITHNMFSYDDIPTCTICGKHKAFFRSYKEGYGICCEDCRAIRDESKKNSIIVNATKRSEIEEQKKHNVYSKDTIVSYFLLDGKSDIFSQPRCRWSYIKHYDMRMFEFIDTYFKKPIDYEKESVTSVLYRIVNDIEDMPVCKMCGKPAMFNNFKYGFYETCSKNCSKKYQSKRFQDCMSNGHIYNQQDIDQEIERNKIYEREYKNRKFDNDEDVFKYLLNEDGSIIDTKYKWTHVFTVPYLFKYLINRYDGKQVDVFNHTVTEILYRMVNHIDEEPKCPICRKPTPFIHFNCGYNVFCSEECYTSDTGRKMANKKSRETKRVRGNFNSSVAQDLFTEYLINKFGEDDVRTEYNKDKRYPYDCDYYIISLDLFIELQGYASHGRHPYNPRSLEDKIKLNDWKSRVSDKTPSYKSFIYTWTVRDVEKRKLAKSEKLNYLEIFSCDIDKVIESFEDYLTKDNKYAVYTFDKRK